jgi:hypothetical protein
MSASESANAPTPRCNEEPRVELRGAAALTPLAAVLILNWFPLPGL